MAVGSSVGSGEGVISGVGDGSGVGVASGVGVGSGDAVGPTLYYGKGAGAGARVNEAHGLQGAEGQGHFAALGQGFHGHAALKMDFFFQLMLRVNLFLD